jgi:hypothetical protein
MMFRASLRKTLYQGTGAISVGRTPSPRIAGESCASLRSCSAVSTIFTNAVQRSLQMRCNVLLSERDKPVIEGDGSRIDANIFRAYAAAREAEFEEKLAKLKASNSTNLITFSSVTPALMNKIDHPEEPANKYLNHSFVESAEMKNIYDGTVTLDAQGEATVTMPSWFEALNRSFCYQLTSIGTPSPELHIASELQKGKFQIAGGKPGSRVSWQVSGVRNDAWAKANQIPVEEEKSHERGHYLHPSLFGQSEDKSVLAVQQRKHFEIDGSRTRREPSIIAK